MDQKIEQRNGAENGRTISALRALRFAVALAVPAGGATLLTSCQNTKLGDLAPEVQGPEKNVKLGYGDSVTVRRSYDRRLSPKDCDNGCTRVAANATAVPVSTDIETHHRDKASIVEGHLSSGGTAVGGVGGLALGLNHGPTKISLDNSSRSDSDASAIAAAKSKAAAEQYQTAQGGNAEQYQSQTGAAKK